MQDHESKRSRVNRRKFVSRRDFVGGAAAMGGAFAFPWHLAQAEGVPNEYDGSKFQLAAPEPNPKSGGVLRSAITDWVRRASCSAARGSPWHGPPG